MTGQPGGVAVGRERAGAGSWQAAGVAGKQRESGYEKLAPTPCSPSATRFGQCLNPPGQALEMYLPEFYSPSSSHVSGAARKVPVRPIAVDNSKHFPHDHGN